MDYKGLTVVELRQTLGKHHEEPPYKKVARFFSIHVTILLATTSVSANCVTFVFGLLLNSIPFILAFGLILNDILLFLLTLIILFVYIILDSVDGELARLRGTVTPVLGKLKDAIPHRIFDPLLIICVALGIFYRTGWFSCIYIGFVALLGRNFDTYVTGRMLLYRRLSYIKAENSVSKGKTEDKTRSFVRDVFSKLRILADYFPHKSVYLLIVCSLLGENYLYACFILWTISLNFKPIMKIIRIFRNPHVISQQDA